jgi:hypothetical protein
MPAWHACVGLVGVVLILGAYFALQAGVLRGDGLRFQLANALGAGAIALSLVYDFNLSAMVTEVAWILISLYGLARGIRVRAARRARVRLRAQRLAALRANAGR